MLLSKHCCFRKGDTDSRCPAKRINITNCTRILQSRGNYRRELKTLKCIWQTFFICSIKSPQCADKYSKKNFFFSHSDFPFWCFDVPKASNFTSGAVQNRETKNRGLGTIVTSIQDSKPRKKNRFLRRFIIFFINKALLYHFLANWLAHNKRMTEKSVFLEAWSSELTSQSFPVSCFWCRGFVPHRKWNLTLLAHQNTGKENRYQKKIFATLMSTLGRFNRANKKKICHIHFKALELENC